MRESRKNKYLMKIKYLCDDFDDQVLTNYILKDLEKTINKILKDKEGENILNQIYQSLNSYERVNFMCYILSTNLNVFNNWYLHLLMISFTSNDIVEQSRSKEIYGLYEKQFNEFKNNN